MSLSHHPLSTSQWRERFVFCIERVLMLESWAAALADGADDDKVIPEGLSRGILPTAIEIAVAKPGCLSGLQVPKWYYLNASLAGYC